MTFSLIQNQCYCSLILTKLLKTFLVIKLKYNTKYNKMYILDKKRKLILFQLVAKVTSNFLSLSTKIHKLKLK